MSNSTPPNPWKNVALRHGFFVPALDVKATREKYMLEAIRQGILATAEVGVYKGFFGVMFRHARQRSESWSRELSEQPGFVPAEPASDPEESHSLKPPESDVPSP